MPTLASARASAASNSSIRATRARGQKRSRIASVVNSGSDMDGETLASDALDDERNALPDADAHRAQRVAAPRALELVHRRRDEPRAARAERMAERDRATVGIHARIVVGEAMVARDGQRLCRERLVQLDHVHLREVEAG